MTIRPTIPLPRRGLSREEAAIYIAGAEAMRDLCVRYAVEMADAATRVGNNVQLQRAYRCMADDINKFELGEDGQPKHLPFAPNTSAPQKGQLGLFGVSDA